MAGKIGVPRDIHGASKDNSWTVEYSAWMNMKSRVRGYTDEQTKLYVDRGITVCQEWETDFLAFLSHIGPRPSSAHSLDRKDNNKGYEPGNVRWATSSEQALNRRNPSRPCMTGARNPRSKLTEEIVLSIRKDSRSYSQLAVLYNVNKSVIEKVKNRKTWRHI